MINSKDNRKNPKIVIEEENRKIMAIALVLIFSMSAMMVVGIRTTEHNAPITVNLNSTNVSQKGILNPNIMSHSYYNNKADVKGWFKDFWGWCDGYGYVNWTFEDSVSPLLKAGYFDANANTFVYTTTASTMPFDSVGWSGTSDTVSSNELHFTGVLNLNTFTPYSSSMTIISKLVQSSPNGVLNSCSEVHWYYYEMGSTSHDITLYVPVEMSETIGA